MFDFLKGKISVQLQKFDYRPGETVTGTVTLKLKKPIKAQGVNVEIMAREKVRERFGNETRTHDRIVYEFKQPLDSEKEYLPGQDFTYQFSLKVPQQPEAPEGAMGQIAKVARFMGGMGVRRWYITARLDIKMGIDIKKTVSISVG